MIPQPMVDTLAKLGEKWGPGSVCAVALVCAGIVGGFKGVPTFWDDYVAERTAKIALEREVRMAQLEAETKARDLERDLQKSTVAAILARQDAANDRLAAINIALDNAGQQIAKGFAASGEMLKGIASDTSRMLALKEHKTGLAPPLIPPSSLFFPRKQNTPKT